MTCTFNGLEAHRVITTEADVWDLVDPRTSKTVAEFLCGDELDEAALRVRRDQETTYA